MGSQIIKQPNGLYCRFSSITDRIEIWNATPEDIIEEMVFNFRENAIRQINEVIDKLNKDEKAYYQFTKTFEEAMEETKKRDPKEYQQILKDTQDI